METYHHFINGSFLEPANGEWLDSTDPYLGKPWARIARGNAADTDKAVAAASAAFHGEWGAMSATKRGKVMMRLADLVKANAKRLAEIEVRDNGKLLSEMTGQLFLPSRMVALLRGTRRQDRRLRYPDRQTRHDGFHPA